MARLPEIDKRYFLMVHPYDTIGNTSESDISVSCPICMEGKSWKRKHRLHMYIKDTYENSAIACFNCGYKTNLRNYLKENHPSEYTLYINEKRNEGLNELKLIDTNKNKKEQECQLEDFEDLSKDGIVNTGLDFSSTVFSDVKKKKNEDINDGHEEKATSQETISSISVGLDFSSCTVSDNTTHNTTQNTKPEPKIYLRIQPKLIEPVKGFVSLPEDAIKYINNRGLEPKKEWLYSPKNNKITFNNTTQFLSEFIIIPLTIGDKWYGFQALGWKQKKFFVYMVSGNTGWKVWNWDNIDKTKKVYIFESIYDAMSSGLDNVIAQLGANLGEDRIDDLKEPTFCLDSQHCDQKSREETLKYLEKGYKCFIWPSGSEKFKDTNDLRKLNVPFEKISKMIENNIYSGLTGTIKMKLL